MRISRQLEQFVIPAVVRRNAFVSLQMSDGEIREVYITDDCEVEFDASIHDLLREKLDGLD